MSGQIRYIGVAFGIGRYQPHAASAVLDNQYGDCKDKHTLLASMLATLGLHPDAVLIGAGVALNNAVPSPAAFNHLITRVQIDDKAVWLDSTAEVAPFRLLPPPDRDKQVLVIPSEGVAVSSALHPPIPSRRSLRSLWSALWTKTSPPTRRSSSRSTTTTKSVSARSSGRSHLPSTANSCSA